MKIWWFLPVLVLAAQAGTGSDDKTVAGGPVPSVKARIAPVLQYDEQFDTVIVRLPGPAPEPVKPKALKAPLPVAVAAPAVEKVEKASVESPEAVDGAAPRPYLRHVERTYPDGFEKDTPKYFQDHIGEWTTAEVSEILGPSTRQRQAFGDDKQENGFIYAFADPTNKYKEFELDFDGQTGKLRSVFAYPEKMTWQDCRRLYGATVAATDASKGRKFYSYTNRRLDVLVGPDGKVISLGLY